MSENLPEMIAGFATEYREEIIRLRQQLAAAETRAEAAEERAREAEAALMPLRDAIGRAMSTLDTFGDSIEWVDVIQEILSAALDAALVPLRRVAEAARKYRQSCKSDGGWHRWGGFASVATELDRALAALDAAQGKGASDGQEQ